MKPIFTFTAALLGIFTITDADARGNPGRGGGGGGDGGGGGGGRASAASRPSVSRPSGGGGGGFSAPRSPATGSKIQRPSARPSPQPATRPAARPETKPSARPETRPATRPSVERPTTRPSPAPGGKPEINRPGNPGNAGNRPDINRPNNNLPGDNRPGNINRPGNNDGPLANRPGANRPSTLPGMVSYPNRPGNNRPNIGNDRVNIGNSGNKVNIGNVNVGGRNNGLNRPSTLPAGNRNWDNNKWGGKNSVWGNNVNIGNNVNVNINNNFRYSNNFAYRPNYWGGSPWWGAGHCHSWHHGHWGYGYNNHYYNSHWYFHDDDDFAKGFMWGIAVWSLGNMVYDMGYNSYKNPYPAPPVQNTTIVYTQPLSVSAAKAPPGDDKTVDTAETKSGEIMERSRTAFKKGDFVTAMSSVDEALSYTPGDVTLHEYRALVLFALGKFADAAGVLNPVLASGPGWGWETMVGFYDSSSTYTAQLRKLEDYTKGKPAAAEGHFLLGYHYMVSDHMDQAYAEFETTAKLQPADSIARQLRDLTKSSLPGDADEETAPVVRPAPVPGEKLVGKWVCDRGADGKVTFTMTADGNYTWGYMNGDKSTDLKGTYGLNDKGLLVLTSEDSQMVSEVTLASDTAMKFVLVGAPDGDPGLEFKKS